MARQVPCSSAGELVDGILGIVDSICTAFVGVRFAWRVTCLLGLRVEINLDLNDMCTQYKL